MNYYDILGIASNADQYEIKRAFRQKALQYHPDRNTDATSGELFHLVYIAYEVLQDPVKRSIYDMMQLARQKDQNSTGSYFSESSSTSSTSSSSSTYSYEQAKTYSQGRAYEEREQRRKAYYKRQENNETTYSQQYAKQENVNDLASKMQFHSNQSLGFFFCFMLLCVGFTSLLFGYMFVSWEHFNGAVLLGCTFWAVGGTLSVVAGKGLMAVFQTWNQH